ncbi:hypothetical protein COCNU_04G007520 [Cocos nucifera]|uniref:Uncharacterized protein n=1 Tax=Cocos nucifera TaxID=13894 RepID=A0A8K0I5X5_COCNU|nr:hypothetical protein COCNU_04G007520 [Cocos nucifera]
MFSITHRDQIGLLLCTACFSDVDIRGQIDGTTSSRQSIGNMQPLPVHLRPSTPRAEAGSVAPPPLCMILLQSRPLRCVSSSTGAVSITLPL